MNYDTLEADTNLACSNYTDGTISNKHFTVYTITVGSR